jgi:hypothetical protein
MIRGGLIAIPGALAVALPRHDLPWFLLVFFALPVVGGLMAYRSSYRKRR